MSDEQERDAAVIAAMQQHVENSDPAEMQEIYGEFTHAALRELDRLTAERDQAREQLAKLEEVCEEYFDVKDALAERSRYGIDSAWYRSMSDAVGKAENAIRAALGIESEAGE